MNTKQAGRFTLSNHFIEACPDDCAKMMSGLLIYRVFPDTFNDTLEYFAYGDAFEEVDASKGVPEYEGIFRTEADKRGNTVTKFIGFTKL